ncbi:MAG: hypothetical protein HC888_10850 [Candidatus Competibacteraceae bacterium]|nr:hypothetical protein [Candidatus Competibacteraceae bacterium]
MAIRQSLREARFERADEDIPRLEPLNWTEAQKSDPASYVPGQVLVLHRKLGQLPGKARLKVVGIGDDRILVQCSEGTTSAAVAVKDSAWSVFRQSTLCVAAGDWIRITAGGTTLDGKHRFNNGALYRVTGITASSIELENGWVIARDFGHLNLGYCLTSHVSQGKTVDRVLIAQPTSSLGAASAEQFYVSVSRGRSGPLSTPTIREPSFRPSRVDRRDRRRVILSKVRLNARGVTFGICKLRAS